MVLDYRIPDELKKSYKEKLEKEEFCIQMFHFLQIKL